MPGLFHEGFITYYILSEEGTTLLVRGKEGETFETDETGNRRLKLMGDAVVELKDTSKKPQAYKIYGNSGSGFPCGRAWENGLLLPINIHPSINHLDFMPKLCFNGYDRYC